MSCLQRRGHAENRAGRKPATYKHETINAQLPR